MKTALFIRLDRMGDLVLSLPCDHLIKNDYQVHWVIPNGLDFVANSSRPVKSFSTLKRDFSWSQFFSFLSHIKKIKPHTSIGFHVPWWVNMALWLSRVPVRGGVLSQWHSYLFLNKGLRQKRSQCEHHEMDYNYLLTEFVFNLKNDPKRWTFLELINPDIHKDFHFDLKQDYFVVHPGMGGSALNWPTSKYHKVIEKLSESTTVVITGTKSDEDYLMPLKKMLNDNPKVVWLDKQLDGYQLLNLLSDAIAILAPSTGVLHLSASLGAPSLGIFSPIKVHQDKRWGPKGKQVVSFTPEVDCKAHFECLQEACPHFFCMDTLQPQAVIQKALSFKS